MSDEPKKKGWRKREEVKAKSDETDKPAEKSEDVKDKEDERPSRRRALSLYTHPRSAKSR